MRDTQLHPIASGENREINPAAPIDINFLKRTYGENQLGVALNFFPIAKLREAAALNGVTPGRSKAETLSRLVSHTTDGRYHAAFAQETAAGSKNPHTRAATSSPRAPRAPTRSSDKFTTTSLKPIAYVGGREVNPATRLDAHFLRVAYGEHQLRAALSLFPASKLRQETEALGIKPGRSIESAISNIIKEVTRESYASSVARMHAAGYRVTHQPG